MTTTTTNTTIRVQGSDYQALVLATLAEHLPPYVSSTVALNLRQIAAAICSRLTEYSGQTFHENIMGEYEASGQPMVVRNIAQALKNLKAHGHIALADSSSYVLTDMGESMVKLTSFAATLQGVAVKILRAVGWDGTVGDNSALQLKAPQTVPSAPSPKKKPAHVTFVVTESFPADDAAPVEAVPVEAPVEAVPVEVSVEAVPVEAPVEAVPVAYEGGEEVPVVQASAEEVQKAFERVAYQNNDRAMRAMHRVAMETGCMGQYQSGHPECHACCFAPWCFRTQQELLAAQGGAK